jgi:DNA invertase Pin-like site-specific DNA recombinase
MAAKHRDMIDFSNDPDNGSKLRPSPTRRRRADRGLPKDEALRDLARTYLETARRLWPDLVRAGTLPAPDDDVLAAMANQFRDLFLEGTIAGSAGAEAIPSGAELASSYLRYSDDSSNPRSLDQQLRLQLERAQHNGHFIPWAYVFADAAVTATTAARRGYELAKQALAMDEIKVLYIDEIGRASRYAIEALRLGRLVEQLGKRMIGVSDGFDSELPTSKIILSLFAMLQEWFIDQWRSKVNRGMDDAFRRGTNLHPPSIGYKLQPAADGQGRPLYGKDGKKLMMKVIDEQEAGHVLEAFQLFGLKRWSRDRIARLFNEKAVDGKRTWDASRIGQLLRRHTYVGIEIYRQRYQIRDPETGKVTVKKRPRQE